VLELSDEGSWTALPIASIAASFLWLTLLRDNRMSPAAIVHLVSFVVLFALAMLAIPASNMQAYWLLLIAVGVLVIEAVLSLVVSPPARQ
jgi:hypothetical protein